MFKLDINKILTVLVKERESRNKEKFIIISNKD